MPLFDIKSWIMGAQEGQSFIVRDGQVSDLPTHYRLWLEAWEDEGFIAYEAKMDYEIATKGNPKGWQVHVTRTEAEI